MIIFLALILIFLVILIGGERGAMSIMTLVGNIVILFFSITFITLRYCFFNPLSGRLPLLFPGRAFRPFFRVRRGGRTRLASVV